MNRPSAEKESIAVRLDLNTRRTIDDVTERLADAAPFTSVTRADGLRYLLRRGAEAVEHEGV